MKLPQVKFGLILSVALCAACAPDRASGSANNHPSVTAAVAGATASPASAAPTRELDVPYVPTPELVVDEMLKMAQVKGDDVLYDLGSGDGRIPITAARRFGTRGVGVDLNPERVKEANENARQAEVTDKVKFIEGDLFQSDFSEASVVTLYLLPDINLKLRPQLLSQLKPGTRVVSHNYDMGDWKPARTKTITTPDGVDHVIYFWRVPERK
ncbi:MAG: SAM-dependent methyltransferase [Pyrinomonadaceae bacterium]